MNEIKQLEIISTKVAEQSVKSYLWKHLRSCVLNINLRACCKQKIMEQIR